MRFSLFLLLFFLIFLAVGISITIYYLVKESQNVVLPKEQVLIDISNFNVCENGLIYVEEIGGNVSTEQVIGSVACLGNTVLGYDNCESKVEPKLEEETASPIAYTNINGVRNLYYLNNSTEIPCCTGLNC